jgi:hypothetical protein
MLNPLVIPMNFMVNKKYNNKKKYNKKWSDIKKL